MTDEQNALYAASDASGALGDVIQVRECIEEMRG